ncbi:MAG: AmmeMemoRadiSam system protein B [Desulfobacterales bacterium]|mgnify:CR=1 FL=1|nr:AmmeMemoRadiSam system protein B [Desulfobacteraceae bacterium]MBT4363096.1 AmmeMemoRadiSam system protein B [Desulfobacteraceae bacterium]MBT7086089.1 AmmeMemoRadiSam system protein B [Desulfobacterales bacterium]
MSARKALFAGSWYPDRPAECEKEIKGFLGEKNTASLPGNYVGGIVPHAGWFFSGSIACNVINALNGEEPVDVIAVFGMHLSSSSLPYITTEGAWETPFGDIQIERDLASELGKRFSFNVETTSRFTQDNTIELQLPFIKYFFPDVKIVPIGVAPNDNAIEIGRAVVDMADTLGLKLKVIGSTDLTHYGTNYGFMPKGTGPDAVDWVKKKNDRQAIDAILDMNAPLLINEAAANQNACCAGAAAAAVSSARELGIEKGLEIAYSTSYDKSPGDSFVGYVGVLF